MSAFPDFSEFYTQLHGREPFPWQVTLAERVLSDGWPDLLDLPTGTGKTSALDIALYAMARDPHRSPRRVVLVVDRRIVVDQGAVHARAIRSTLHAATDGPLYVVARALRSLFGAGDESPPFAVAVLRGGTPRDDDWAQRPDQPVLGVSTVDQVGSRLLFRGYGVSPKLASIHAGLMGNDSLILLDEVHLAVPFAQTLRAVRDQYNHPGGGLPSRFTVVEMSATPAGQRPERTLGLSDDDLRHPTLKARLEARKPTRVRVVTVRGTESDRRATIAAEAVKEVTSLRQGGAKTIGVVLNRVDTARMVHALLSSDPVLGRVVLVTGRMRPLDRDLVVGDALRHADAARNRETADPIIVVATQCIEAGADLDFDALVTELASFDALKQRFGRLDRRGTVTAETGSASGVILAREDLLRDDTVDPVYGTSLAPTFTYLGSRAESGCVDFGVLVLAKAAVDATIANTLTVTPKSAPVLLPGHIDAWSQTSPFLEPDPDPDVALWLHGPDRDAAEVSIVWRADLTFEALGSWVAASTIAGDIVEALEMVRPSPLEALTLPLHAARAWLKGDAVPAVSDVIGELIPADEPDRKALVTAEPHVCLVRRGQEWCPANASELRPGDQLVVPAARGGLSAHSFDPHAVEPVIDLGDLAQLRGRGTLTVRTHPAVLQWLGAGLHPPVLDADATPREDRALLAEWLSALPDRVPPRLSAGEWHQLRAARLTRHPIRVGGYDTNGGVIESLIGAEKLAWQPAIALEGREASTEDDRGNFSATDRSVLQHLGDVGEKVRQYATGLGFSDSVTEDLILAGMLHDVGKVDPRFQLLLAGGDEVTLVTFDGPQAKSRLPAASRQQARAVALRAKLPEGYRHELSSLAMLERSVAVAERAHDLDLVLHLVASHHGWCRPFAPAIDSTVDGDAPTLTLTMEHPFNATLEASAAHAYARIDSGVAERFWRVQERYGAWGLAWLEAILRLADHRASEDLEHRSVK